MKRDPAGIVKKAQRQKRVASICWSEGMKDMEEGPFGDDTEAEIEQEIDNQTVLQERKIVAQIQQQIVNYSEQQTSADNATSDTCSRITSTRNVALSPHPGQQDTSSPTTLSSLKNRL